MTFALIGAEGGTAGEAGKNAPAHVPRRRHLPDKTYDKRVYATGIYYRGISAGSENVPRAIIIYSR